MKYKWPTLEGRLNNSLTNRFETLLQLEKFCELSEKAKKELKKLKIKFDNQKEMI